MRKIISGDQVKVVAGSDVGKVGVVQKVLPPMRCGQGLRVIVSDVNVRRFLKKSQMGKKFEFRAFPVAISNVALVGEGGITSKIGFALKDSVKRRIFKKTGEFV